MDFRTLFDLEAPYVWRNLRRLGVPDRDVEDAVHEVFMAVHRHLSDYDRTRPVRPWLFGFCIRVGLQSRRKAHVRYEVFSQEGSEHVDPRRPQEEHEARSLVLRALDGLDDTRRTVFVLCELEGSTAKEVADALGIPENTVYSRLRLAREEFKAAVQRLTTKGGKR